MNKTFNKYKAAMSGDGENIREQLVNYISLITITNMMIYVLIYCVVDFQLFMHASIFLSFGSLINLGIIFLNIRGNHLLSKILLSVLTPFYMSYIAVVVFGTAPGFQVYLFVAAIIPLFLWDHSQKQFPVIIISTILIAYIIIEFFSPLMQPLTILPDNYIYIFRLTNVAVCFSAAGIAIGAFQYLYRKKEEQLIQKTEELLISQAHKDKVYSIIAHDLKGPFGNFVAMIELFINNYKDIPDEKRLEIMKSMFQTSGSLKSLLENLLNWSKKQSGTMGQSFKELSLKKLVEETLDIYKEQILKKEQIIDLKIEDKILIYADRHMVSTVIRNLVSNAIKFTGHSGRISISAVEYKEKVKVCIEDSGIGLSGKDIRNLFDITRIDEISNESAEKGSGLGLLLCKDFIECNNGEIWVESEPGKGSKFYFTLPILSLKAS